jgi:hypothetical protein
MKTYLQTMKMKIVLTGSLFFFMSIFINAQLITPQNHQTGVIFLSDSAYAKLPRPNWDILKKYAPRSLTAVQTTSGIVMLNTPPIGDQGHEGSCVGWAVGYTALGILMYPQYNNWNSARRSPNYVYNQIKLSSDCTVGSQTIDALNLVCNQGDCSWNSMPYADGDCATQPNTTTTDRSCTKQSVTVDSLKQYRYYEYETGYRFGLSRSHCF